jgi:hypothetical protein
MVTEIIYKDYELPLSTEALGRFCAHVFVASQNTQQSGGIVGVNTAYNTPLSKWGVDRSIDVMVVKVRASTRIHELIGEFFRTEALP